jgi:acetyltransferase-like isoleucine patch superfamily enzyme
MLNISISAKISKFADIEDSVRGSKIVISDHVTIDSFVKIKPAGGLGDLYIGENSVINSGCVLYTGNGITIGKNVAIAANCTFAPTNHQFKRKDVLIREQGFQPSRGGIVIEDDVWIGAGCTLLDGTHVKKGAVIGAGSIVNGVIEAFTINAGNPLRKISERC